MIFSTKKCWYCKRVGRFGFKRRRSPLAPECHYDQKCFARARVERLPAR